MSMENEGKSINTIPPKYTRYFIIGFFLLTFLTLLLIGKTIYHHAGQGMQKLAYATHLPIAVEHNTSIILKPQANPPPSPLSLILYTESGQNSNFTTLTENEHEKHEIFDQEKHISPDMKILGKSQHQDRLKEQDILAFLLLIVAVILFAVIGLKLIVRKLKHIETKRQAINEGILQSKKMTSIGQLSVGIAHEINNPIACIKEEAGWMKDILNRESMRNIPDHDELLDSLREIDKQTQRCSKITHKLLSFGRKMDSEIQEIDLNSLVDEVVRLKERENGSAAINFLKSYEKNLPCIFSDPSQLRQVFFNLVSNAMDAVRDTNGEIQISTKKNNDKTISVSISDTGIGIPAEAQAKIFDPFFTTKETGKGMGLGLSICHGIIEKFGGNISMSSEVGRGTTFTVTLPLENAEREPA